MCILKESGGLCFLSRGDQSCPKGMDWATAAADHHSDCCYERQATVTCPRCGKVNDLASLIEIIEYVEDQAVAGLCSCGELHDLSPSLETEYWQLRMYHLEQEWSRGLHHPF